MQVSEYKSEELRSKLLILVNFVAKGSISVPLSEFERD